MPLRHDSVGQGAPYWPRQSPPLIPSLPHLLLYLLVSSTFPFSLSYSLHLFSCFSVPSHSTRIVPLHFQAGCRPPPGFSFCVCSILYCFVLYLILFRLAVAEVVWAGVDTFLFLSEQCQSTKGNSKGWFQSKRVAQLASFITGPPMDQTSNTRVRLSFVMRRTHMQRNSPGAACGGPVVLRFVRFLMPSPPDSVGKGVLFSDCPFHSSVCPVRSCYHDISWTAWTILTKLTGNIYCPILMGWLDFGGQRSRSQHA